MPDGRPLLSDADGWFQVVRLTPTGTTDRADRGDRERRPGGGVGYAPPHHPTVSAVHIEVHDGLQDLVVGAETTTPPK
jgi:hypothetical protein